MAYYIYQSPGRIIQIKGDDYLYFGGTSYLGLQSNPEFTHLLAGYLKIYGSSYGASRWSNLRLGIYEEAENYLAGWAGAEAALTVSSGFLAGQLVSSFFNRDIYKTFYAPNTHAALMQGQLAAYTDYESLGQAIKHHLGANSHRIPVLFTDSVDLSGSAYPDYGPLRALPLDQIVLVADDSHTFGFLGPSGGGTYRMLKELGPKELVVCASLGKALGLQGGVILCSDERRNSLWDTAFFAGASPAPPAHMAALVSAGEIYHKQRDLLATNIRCFNKEWNNRMGFTSIENYPVISYNNPELTAYLEGRKILVTDFPYPSSRADSFPGRIVLSAHHQISDILRLAGLLNSFPRPLGK